MTLAVIDIGEWWTEYRCSECSKQFVLAPEDDETKCPFCDAPAFTKEPQP